MPGAQTSELDRAVEVVPPIRHTVPWRVAAVMALPDSRLRVSFVDGISGEVDMKSFLSSDVVEGTIFSALRDPSVFSQVKVVMGAVEWACGADLAPDAMYESIKERGVWVVE